MLRLSAHPAGARTRAEVVVAARRRDDGALLLDYHLSHPASRAGAAGEPGAAGAGDPGELAPPLQIPATARPLPVDRLWAYTCFEAFVGRAGAPGYREFNFSPSGQWAGWTFSDYRQRDDAAPALPAPQLDWWRAGDGAPATSPVSSLPEVVEPAASSVSAAPPVAAPVAVPVAAGKCQPLLILRAVLPAAALPPGDGALQLGLTAVVVRADGDAAYFALQHPLGRPDFHHRAGFVLSLPG